MRAALATSSRPELRARSHGTGRLGATRRERIRPTCRRKYPGGSLMRPCRGVCRMLGSATNRALAPRPASRAPGADTFPHLTASRGSLHLRRHDYVSSRCAPAPYTDRQAHRRGAGRRRALYECRNCARWPSCHHQRRFVPRSRRHRYSTGDQHIGVFAGSRHHSRLISGEPRHAHARHVEQDPSQRGLQGEPQATQARCPIPCAGIS